MSQVAVEALYSATYVENYLDSVENLPDDAQKYFTRIRELDIQYRNYLRDADHFYDQWSTSGDQETVAGGGLKKGRAMSRMQQSLIAARELGDEKMQLAQSLQELIDHKVRQLEHDYKNLDYGQDELMQTESQKDAYQFPHVASPMPNSPSATTSGNTSAFGGGAQGFTSSFSGNGGGGVAAMVGGGNGERHSSSNSNGSSTGNYNTSSNNNNTGSGKRARRVRTDVGDMGSSDSNLENNGKGMSSYGNSSLNLPGGSAQQHHQGNRKGQAQQGVTNSGKKKKRKTRVQGTGANSAANTSASGGGGGGMAGSTAGSGNNNNNNSSSNNLAALHSASRDMRDDTPPQEDTIDPDEPTYCLCDQISFGEMILCDNDLCPIEWFHFSCVSLISKPKGKWYCPNCRGDRPNIMKNKAQFLKELERYNKEREEKT